MIQENVMIKIFITCSNREDIALNKGEKHLERVFLKLEMIFMSVTWYYYAYY